MYCLGEHPQLGPIGYFDMQLPFWVCMIATYVVYILLLSWYSSDIVNSCDIEGDIDDHVHICKLNSRFDVDIYLQVIIFWGIWRVVPHLCYI